MKKRFYQGFHLLSDRSFWQLIYNYRFLAFAVIIFAFIAFCPFMMGDVSQFYGTYFYICCLVVICSFLGVFSTRIFHSLFCSTNPYMLDNDVKYETINDVAYLRKQEFCSGHSQTIYLYTAFDKNKNVLFQFTSKQPYSNFLLKKLDHVREVA